MTTLHQWLEGKKKSTTSTIHTSDIITISSTGIALEQNKGYNECLDDIQASLPTLLSTMEAELREGMRS